MTNIISYLKNNYEINKILTKYFPDLESIKNEKELVEKTSDLDFVSMLLLYDELDSLYQPKTPMVGIFLLMLDMDIRFKIDQMEKEMESLNPDIFVKKYKDFFAKLISFKTKIIRKGKIMYRSRKGCYEILFISFGLTNNYHYYPYSNNDISNPPIELAKSERFNRERYSYLYLANDINTALSEIRPEVEETCSVGTFKARKKLKLVDLKYNKKFEDIVLRTATKGWKVYYFSQFISDIAKELQFDGIWYRSVQSKGECAVIFNPENFFFVEKSEQMCKILQNKIKYEVLKDEKETTSFLVKGHKKIDDLNSSIHCDENVLKYIESNDDAKEMFDINVFDKNY